MAEDKRQRAPRKPKFEAEARAKQVELTPKTENQALYMRSLNEHQQTIVLGPAGTGKSYVAAVHAANAYLRRDIRKIILTRPNVAASKSLGFFPGTLDEKMDPWMRPILDVLEDVLGKGKVETDRKKGNIEVAPFETMRGRSFENCMVLLDEAQNTTVSELKMFLTRMGQGSQAVINGDIAQTDLGRDSGLAKIIHMAKKYQLPLGVVEFTVDDIVRSDMVKQWIIAFDKEGL